MASLQLRVAGREYAGWTAARVTRGMECLAGSFELTATDRWAQQATPWPVGEEDECVLTIDGEPVITGYVDTRRLSFDGVSFGGRDRTAALVDCSAMLKHDETGKGKWEFLNVSLETLTRQLCGPFGIPVAVQTGLVLPRVAKLTIDPGDTAFDALERACRMAGVLAVAYGEGSLLLTRAGANRATTAIVEGENILGGSAEYSAVGRFRRYVVLGQHQGSDDLEPEYAATVRGEATDTTVRRKERVLLVRPEGSVTPALAQRRAQWEAKVRAGRAASVGVRVQGWQQRDGSLWPINARVPVRSRRLGVDGEMLITQVTFSLDNSGGTVTDLTLRRPDAFLPEPVILKEKGERWKELAGGV